MNTAPRILIMVLSSGKPPYDLLMEAQRETWDSVRYPGVSTLYYLGGWNGLNGNVDGSGFYFHSVEPGKEWSETVAFNCSDEYYEMHWKFKLALDHALTEMGSDWDIIFRTNSSSYINKAKLAEFAKSLPAEKLYAGWTMKDTNHDGGDCVSGAGIFLSKDCAEILRSSFAPEENCEEDVLIGRMLRANGVQAIDDRQRVEHYDSPNKMISTYHIRFKTKNRGEDAKSMLSLHNKLKPFL